MYVVFVEYMIFYHSKLEYLEYMAIMQLKNPTMELLESADQAGLFVEIWREIDEENFLNMQKGRLGQNQSSRGDLHKMIDITKSPIRIWRFNQIQVS